MHGQQNIKTSKFKDFSIKKKDELNCNGKVAKISSGGLLSNEALVEPAGIKKTVKCFTDGEENPLILWNASFNVVFSRVA